jgi:transcriptional regulator with XRE-family HTH domain
MVVNSFTALFRGIFTKNIVRCFMYEIFEQLLKAYDMTIYKFCKETGVSESTIYTWKKKGTMCGSKLQKIVCEYFKVSADYLMTGEEQQETKMKPGVNIVDKSGNVKTFDINSVMYAIMKSVMNMPPEQQEMVNNMVGGNNKPKKTIYVENPQNRKQTVNTNSGKIIEGHFTNVDDALAYIQQETSLVAAFDGKTDKEEVILQMANAIYMNRTKK